MVESHQGRGKCWRGERGLEGGGRVWSDEGGRREGWGVMKVGE